MRSFQLPRFSSYSIFFKARAIKRGGFTVLRDYNQKFVFYESVKEQIDRVEEAFGVELAYKVCKAVMEYGLYNIRPSEDDKQLWACGLEPIMASINAAQKRYDTAVANGKKGGRPKKEIDRKLVEEKLAEGWSKRSIAHLVGVGEDTLRRRLEEWKEQQNLKTQEKPNANNDTQNLKTQGKPIGFETAKQQNLNKNKNINKNREEDISAADAPLRDEIAEIWR